ncbi:MAG TPA: phosphatidate cytidylyltransferase [Acetobacteraceae bacterium]|nr:phosphatidate cytidylyltransferase [Acetobacteraceae bacterium]
MAPVQADIAARPAESASARGAARWRDLRQRGASAAVLIPCALVCVWLGGPVFAVLVVLAVVGLAWEWAALCGAASAAWTRGIVIVAATVPVVLAAVGETPAGLVAVPVAAAAAALLARRTESVPARRAEQAFGVIYVAVPAIALLWLRADAGAGLANLLFLLGAVWVADSGAYVAGRALGGPKLAPVISPGKTWSGAIGGVVAAAVFGGITAALDPLAVAWWYAVVLAAGIAVIGQAGDLFESRLKRHFGVKDSGRLIPGHGGLLDRLDALLAVAPVAAVLALALGPGVVLWR